MTEGIHPNLRHLPFGRKVQARLDFTEWGPFPYDLTGPLPLRALAQPLAEEPPRRGEAGAQECPNCARPDDRYLWTDEHWRLTALGEASASPAVVLLEPREHVDLDTLPPERAVQLGPMMQRVERAVLGIGGVGRVHISRWGDGAAHLHWWFLARPLGVAQMRGTFMALWDDLLPAVPQEQWRANLASIAASMAEAGGTAHARLES